ncbi:MAG TPA: response regulator [Candidatus Binatia bacterium]|nr:response regulator [Candidatus Binatia bacterium]
MNAPPKLLVVDDAPKNVKLLADLLGAKGYHAITAYSGGEALKKLENEKPDMVLLDVVMPEMSGYEVCRRMREMDVTRFVPVVMITALDPAEERVKGIEAGADDFISKPINQAELLARVKSLLRVKEYHDRIQAQAAELAEWNRNLEEKVRQQVEQIEKMSRFKRYVSPQIAELILKTEDYDYLKSHRREITVVFLDLRGFTAFSDSAEPEEVLALLRGYHAEMGKVIFSFDGTLEHFAGDGIMVFFNDPVPCEDHTERAARMALEMRTRVKELRLDWLKKGYDLDLGIGLVAGYATLGNFGFEGRIEYGVVGNVANLAARLCGEAKGGQILTNQRTLNKIENIVEAEKVGDFTLKGLLRPVTAFNVLGPRGA